MPGGARSWLTVSVCCFAGAVREPRPLPRASGCRFPVPERGGSLPLLFIFRYLCTVSWLPASYLNTQHWRCSFVEIQMHLPASQAVARSGLACKSSSGLLSLQLVKTAELDPSRNYLAGFHPHGILVAGAFVNLCTESTGFSSLFPGIRPHLMMLNLWFWTPFFRDYIMSGGDAAHLLSRKEGGNLLAIVVGGAQEALNARPGATTLLLRNRKGFVRLALMHGAALVPIFSFGENEIFDQVENSPGSWLRRIQNRLQKVMGISLPLFHGRGVFQYSFGLLPYRQPITTVGEPRTPDPSQEEVDELHQRYMKELSDLFEAHKLKYNVPVDQHLEFC
uniref:Acyltransferase n=1 Tax=Ursus americanus TaxID=9643 RepID=A0A452RK00_URSAM